MDRQGELLFGSNRRRPLVWLCVIGLLIAAPGCGSLFGKRKIVQLQSESERLLTEYRLERDRAERLDIQNRALTDRISQLERRLAGSIDGYQPRGIADRTRPVDDPRFKQRDDWTPASRR